MRADISHPRITSESRTSAIRAIPVSWETGKLIPVVLSVLLSHFVSTATGTACDDVNFIVR